MKKNLLFILLLMIFIIPIKVDGKEAYFNHGEYNYSDEYKEERKDLEVIKITENDKVTYKYRTRDYIILPVDITITSRDFTIESVLDTNILLEEMDIELNYDLKKDNNCYGTISVQYKGTKMSRLVTIRIPYYIEITNEIIVESKEFNIWNYIETDIVDKENINIIGNYNLDINGEYELEINYKELSKKTKIIVNIEENNKVEEEVIPEVNDEVIKEENTIVLEKERIITKACTNNYYETCSDNKIEYVEKIVPVANKTTCKNIDYNKSFRYASYAFYGLSIILLSIIVVRKK